MSDLNKRLEEIVERAVVNGSGLAAKLVSGDANGVTCTRLRHGYLGTVTASGAAIGGVAATPGIGTGASIAASFAEFGTTLGVTCGYVLTECARHGIAADDLERRRALLLISVVGAGGETVERIAGRTGAHLGKRIAEEIPLTSIRQLNRVLGHQFVTRYGTKRGVLVLGRAMPFGVGALIGGAGNHLIGRGVVHTVGQIFECSGPEADAACAA